MKMRRNRRGLTVVEVMIALLIMTVGILAIMSTTAFATRTMTRGRQADMAATFAGARMEQQRTLTCQNQANGGYSKYTSGPSTGQNITADTLKRNGVNLVINSWTYTNPAGTSTYRLALVTTYIGERGKVRVIKSDTEMSCLL
jgi:Tfp pilus assembly protein PilV